jgi:hypothetical protein
LRTFFLTVDCVLLYSMDSILLMLLGGL